MNGIEAITIFIIKLAVIFYAARFLGRLFIKLKLPCFAGEIVAGLVIGPFALGGMPLPWFSEGVFSGEIYFSEFGTFEISSGLYIFVIAAIIIFIFTSGLKTNIARNLCYSLAGFFVGTGGVIVSFITGFFIGTLIAPGSVSAGLFLGLISCLASSNIAAGSLSKNKKINSPEGVTIISAALFDDLLGIIGFTAITIIFLLMAVIKGQFNPDTGGALFLITGAYIAGLILSKTRRAPIIQNRIYDICKIFRTILIAIIGMMADFRILINTEALLFGAFFVFVIIIAKIAGSGFAALLLGFNVRGSLRIGTGMIPCGELSLIFACLGLCWGFLDTYVFGIIIFMIILTAVVSAPLLNISLKIKGKGTKRSVKGYDTLSCSWDFPSMEITEHICNCLFNKLTQEKFCIQTIIADKKLFLARKDNIALSIILNDKSQGRSPEKSLCIETDSDDMAYVKNIVNEAISGLYDSVRKLKELHDSNAAGREKSGKPLTNNDLLAFITPDCINVSLKGNTKAEIITELVDILESRSKLINHELALKDVFLREKIMSTGMQHGIALPHAKSSGVKSMAVALGIKKEGVDFESSDGLKSRIFILVISPRETSGHHVKFLSAISAVLKDKKLREELINSASVEDAVRILQSGGHKP